LPFGGRQRRKRQKAAIELEVFATGINGGDTINHTLLSQFINLAKAMVEQLRPWMVLRATDTSNSVSASTQGAWQTVIDLSTIARFNRFYEDSDTPPIQLFDGNNRVEDYWQKPFNQRLRSKDISNTFVYDEANKLLYLNGTVMGGTAWINHIKDSANLDITSAATELRGLDHRLASSALDCSSTE
jgi:hypothetical protein